MATVPATARGSVGSTAASSVRRSSPLRSLRITFTGLLAVAVMALVATASFTSEANLLLLLFGTAAGLLLFNLTACVRTVRRIDVDRIISGTAVAGRPFPITYAVRNRRRWFRAWAVVVGEIPQGTRPELDRVFVPVLAPGEERRIQVTAACPERGRIQLPGIRIACGFPFGLFTCHTDIRSPAQVIVYPAVGRVRREFWHQHLPVQSSNTRHLEGASGDDEFHGVREYRQGDNPRWIHWRRSARTGELVIREHQPNRESQLICVVDPWPSLPQPASGRGLWPSMRKPVETRHTDEKAERLISAAATAACEAVDKGYRVGLVCRAAVPVILAPAGGRAHRRRLLQELALLTPGTPASIDQLLRGIRWIASGNTRCLVFTTRPEEAHDRLLRMLAGRSESLMLVSTQSGWLDRLFDLTGLGDQRRPTP